MCNSLIFGFTILIGCLASFCQKTEPPATGQNQRPILTVTDTIHGMDTVEFLFVQVTSDGKAEWEKFDTGWKRQRSSSVLVAEEFASIVQRLNSIDMSKLSGKMGPYNTYTDTSAELGIRVFTPTGETDISIINPWPCTVPSCSLGKKRAMPVEVKTLFCEVSALRSQVSGEPLPSSCKSTNTPPGKK